MKNIALIFLMLIFLMLIILKNVVYWTSLHSISTMSADLQGRKQAWTIVQSLSLVRKLWSL